MAGTFIELPDTGGSGGTVTDVTASSPLASSGGVTPNISLTGIVPAANGGFGLAQTRTAITTVGTINNQALATGWIDFTGASAVTLNGLVAQADGTTVILTNNLSGSALLTLNSENAGSTAANRFKFSVATVVVTYGNSIALKYSTAFSRWFPVSVVPQASTTEIGTVNISAQSFAGIKTFTNSLKTPSVYDSVGNVVLDCTNFLLGAGLPANTMIDMAQYKINANSNSLAIDIGNRLLTNSSSIGTLDWANHRLTNAGSIVVADWNIGYLYDSNPTVSIDWPGRRLYNSSGQNVVYWDSGIMYDNSGIESVLWNARQLDDSSGQPAMYWSNRQLGDSGGSVVVGWGARGLYFGTNLGLEDGSNVTVDPTNKLLMSSGTTYFNWNGGINFFGGSAQPQQTSSGAQTAGALYTSTEQTMLQEAYNALRAYGLLT